MRVGFSALSAFILAVSAAHAYEPVTALDDPFAIPSSLTLSESILNCPGSESFLRGTTALVARSVPFGVDELAVVTGAAARGFGRFGASVSFSGSGFDLYGDDTEKTGCSLLIGGGFSAGVRLTRYGMRMKGYGNASAWSTDAGAVWHPGELVWLAASVEDVAGAELGESHEPVDGRIRANAAWTAARGTVLFVEMVKVRRFDPSTSAGFMMELSPNFLAGAAAGTEPDRIDFLAAVTVRSARCSYRGSFHRELGFSHGFSLGWGGK